MKARKTSSDAGFTLIELLSVVGIIAVLLGILLPALAAARANARGIACAANLRQIGVFATQYLIDSSGRLPNNSYTLGDSPASIVPAPPPASAEAYDSSTLGTGSTCDFEWFDAVAQVNGWRGGRTVASRYVSGQADSFRQITQFLWCPDIDQSRWDPGVFATNYGISFNVSFQFQLQTKPLPTGTDASSYDFLAVKRIPRQANVVFLAEGDFYNSNSEPYNITNGSMANVSKYGGTTMMPQVAHKGLNYLFFDGHVSRERKPPHSMGSEIGTFRTLDGDSYTITAADDNAFWKEVVAR